MTVKDLGCTSQLSLPPELSVTLPLQSPVFERPLPERWAAEVASADQTGLELGIIYDLSICYPNQNSPVCNKPSAIW